MPIEIIPPSLPPKCEKFIHSSSYVSAGATVTLLDEAFEGLAIIKVEGNGSTYVYVDIYVDGSLVESIRSDTEKLTIWLCSNHIKIESRNRDTTYGHYDSDLRVYLLEAKAVT